MERRLATSEEWRHVVAATVQSMGIAAWEWDLQEGTIWWSENLGPMVGREPGYIPRSPDEARSLFAPADRPTGADEVVAAMQEAGQVEVERLALCPDGSTRWTLHRYFLRRGTDGSPATIFGLVTDIDADKRAAEREHLLVAAADLLAGSLQPEVLLDRLAELVVPRLADWYGVFLLSGDQVEARSISHSLPENTAAARALLQRRHVRLDLDEGMAEAVREGRPKLVTGEDLEALLAPVAVDEQEGPGLYGLGIDSALYVPLITGSRMLGVLTLGRERGKSPFDQSEMAFAEELAGRLAAAVERAQLHEAIGDVADRLATINRISAQLSVAFQIDEVARVTGEEILPAVGAARGTVVVRDPEAGTSRLVAAPGYGEDRVARWSPDLNSGNTPIGEAIRSGNPVFVASIEDWEQRYPEASAQVGRPLGDSWAAVPLLGRSGVVGAVGLSFDEPTRFDTPLIDLILSISRQAGIALERAQLFERHRHTSEVLQRGLLPEAFPDLPGIEAATLYEASGASEVGGDWYDLFETAGKAVIAVIGDVVGHGIPAVNTMAQLRHSLRAYLFEDRPPASALAAANQMMRSMVDEEYRFATAAILRYEPEHALVRLVVAGHPLPILRTPGGTTVAGAVPGPPLGATDGDRWTETVIDLEGPTLALLYSDGWLDFPGSEHERQLELVRGALEDAIPRPQEVLDLLGERLRDRVRSDDAAAMVVKLKA